MERYFKNSVLGVIIAIVMSIGLGLVPAFLTLRSYQAQLPDGEHLSDKVQLARLLGYAVILASGIFMAYLYHRQKKVGLALTFYRISWVVTFLVFGNEFLARVPSQSIIALLRITSEMVPGYISYPDFLIFIKICIAASAVGYVYAIIVLGAAVNELYWFSMRLARQAPVNSPNI